MMTTITDARPDVDADTREIQALAALHTRYPSLYVTTWIALVRRPQRLATAHCAIALPDGYAVHTVLDNGTLGTLIERVRL